MPAIVFAPMDGVTDAPMRALFASLGAFDYAVSEFVRVSASVIPLYVFRRDIPELAQSEPVSMPVQVQILGGDCDRMAQTALNAVEAGAQAIDINFGCPAPTVNRNDGGASILRHPRRIFGIVHAIREALPPTIPLSAKLRLGWDSVDEIHENAEMAASAGASWLTIHARTKAQGYAPPVDWKPLARVRESLRIPIIANGDIRSIEDYCRCRETTGCIHVMIGRGALANPKLLFDIRRLNGSKPSIEKGDLSWDALFRRFIEISYGMGWTDDRGLLGRLKQWSKIAHAFGDFQPFREVATSTSVSEFLERVASLDRRFGCDGERGSQRLTA